VTTAFTSILQHAVEHVPGAIGAIFADWDGEAVDQFGLDKDTLMLLGAHYGIIFNHVQSALLTFHFGETVEIVLMHDRMDLLVNAVGQGYYVLLAVEGGAHLATALREVRVAASLLRKEMV
jgi:predicted regulator of Ras-like GTPase activity (Roadblock/LC7/MglB family)